MLKTTFKTVLPTWVWNRLKQIRQMLVSVQENLFMLACRRFGKTNPIPFQRALEAAGYRVTRSEDYYAPLPSVTLLKANFKRWRRPSHLLGLQYDLDDMRTTLSELLACYSGEFMKFPDYAEVRQMGFGPGYTAVDAMTLYMMIRSLKPKRYIEVGSGVSTYYCSLAAQRNAGEGHPLQITCIEPYPYERLSTIPGIEILQKKVEDADTSLFRQLEANDVLFIDSSHVLRVDGDVPFLYLEVLPVLNVGVVIHIHDIPFPYNFPYPPELWIFGQDWPVFWNEAMVLQAFLAFNANFKIILSTPLIRHLSESFLMKNIPIYESLEQNPNTFSSIWLKRNS